MATPARAFRWPFPSAGRSIDPGVVQEAWREWSSTRSPGARDILLQRYIHLVRYMANRLASALPPAVDADDLVSAGAAGFLAALEAFDPTLGVDFSVYALTRIRGAMVDSIREMDSVSRRARRRLRDLERALSGLEHELSRPPTDEEAAARLGVPVEVFQDLLGHATAALTLSLDTVEGATGEDGRPSTYPRIADPAAEDQLAALLARERAGRLAALVRELPRAQQLVLQLHYVEELNFREIGMIMDISESRATQYHSAAILALRARMRPAAIEEETLR
jgi:RNA polymerase sigma factor for flagellar operon FliA